MANIKINGIKIKGGNTVIGSVEKINISNTKCFSNIDFDELSKDIKSIRDHIDSEASEKKEIIDVLIELEKSIHNKNSTKIQHIVKTSGELLKEFSISASASYLASLI